MDGQQASPSEKLHHQFAGEKKILKNPHVDGIFLLDKKELQNVPLYPPLSVCIQISPFPAFAHTLSFYFFYLSLRPEE